MAKPFLFLDVDGVILAEREHLTFIPVGTRERLARLLPVFEPVWATAWLGAAHPTFRDDLDLPDESWPYVDYKDFKLTAILRFAGGRPWAWVDDDAKWELASLGDSFRDLPSSLVICPSYKVGITDEHVEALLAFAEAYDERGTN
jgi:hypothetical protein